MISYKKQANSWKNIKIFLSGRRVGTIRAVENGWQYFPYQSNDGGEVFETITEAKNSLEEP